MCIGSLLSDKGFYPVHIEKLNYTTWNHSLLEFMPDSLVKFVLDDEWNKAVGRIPPFGATLFVRFRVNTNVNYDIVKAAFQALV